jgi:hypothetical protein
MGPRVGTDMSRSLFFWDTACTSLHDGCPTFLDSVVVLHHQAWITQWQSAYPRTTQTSTAPLQKPKNSLIWKLQWTENLLPLPENKRFHIHHCLQPSHCTDKAIQPLAKISSQIVDTGLEAGWWFKFQPLEALSMDHLTKNSTLTTPNKFLMYWLTTTNLCNEDMLSESFPASEFSNPYLQNFQCGCCKFWGVTNTGTTHRIKGLRKTLNFCWHKFTFQWWSTKADLVRSHSW